MMKTVATKTLKKIVSLNNVPLHRHLHALRANWCHKMRDLCLFFFLFIFLLTFDNYKHLIIPTSNFTK